MRQLITDEVRGKVFRAKEKFLEIQVTLYYNPFISLSQELCSKIVMTMSKASFDIIPTLPAQSQMREIKSVILFFIF